MIELTHINGENVVLQNPESEVTELLVHFYQQTGILGSIYEAGGKDGEVG